ncbi:ATPase (plasmid) [Cryobacterium sp. LW097]|uniref:MinD/ParA family ATP-binding protein n=1 Tax=unclassified Cryobacterium TaxID=2649013 RepID=UPI000B4C6B4B|nr:MULTISPECIES: ATPase [unclassified Cryobacterium]ASD24196.1 ATPase [Cryobacterium sp. LW097]TFC56817.1 ATPase [Cryobacterium sp. TMB1-7]TFC57906.1 ATPase [Cryobacterium sp. TMB3-1-2]TFC70095.1 ATPase [Cryobacterium sp. TMB3-15]TFC75465.1 ATPase [Cryobacterium sp. TMB3-10]
MAQHDPDQPTIYATVRGDLTGVLDVDGVKHDVTGTDDADVRTQIFSQVTGRARMAGRPVLLVTDDALGQGRLNVHPDGKVEAVGDFVYNEKDDTTPSRIVTAPPAAQSKVKDAPAVAPAAMISPPPATTRAAIKDAAEPVVTSERRAARASFLVQETPQEPASRGWRGMLSRAGIQVAPSAEEMAERADVHAVSQHWAGPRTISIVNGKGGANKTPSTAILAAVFARYGGSGVLAWDNNETRGTLGWRTEQGGHDATVQDLLPQTNRLLSPGAQSSDLAHYVHHQTGDKYDVLRSNPIVLSAEQKITRAEFDSLHQVASKYFRLVFVDSGNDESAERWQQMIERTNQLVIATTALDESAEAGALLLEALAQRDERSAQLAANAVVIVSQSEKTASGAQAIADGFAVLARRAVTIPYDDALHGGKLRYDALAPATKRAWLAAAAAVAEGL